MLITKTIELGLNIENPIALCGDAENNLLAMLIETYNGVCIRGCRIEQITRIINRSECIIENRGGCGEGVIYLTIEIKATYLYPGEVLMGCKLIKKDEYVARFSHVDEMSIITKMTPFLENIAVGQIIPLVIGESHYEISQKKISVNAMPFLPSRTAYAYNINYTLGENEIPILNEIKEQKEILRQKSPEAVKFFTDILLPYQEEQLNLLGATSISLDEIGVGTTLQGWYCFNPCVKQSSGVVFRYEDEPAAPNIIVLHVVSSEPAINKILLEYSQHLQNIIAMIRLYPLANLAEYNNLWRQYLAVKKIAL